jgi:tetratricopeptide (TPR) repeat protein
VSVPNLHKYSSLGDKEEADKSPTHPADQKYPTPITRRPIKYSNSREADSSLRDVFVLSGDWFSSSPSPFNELYPFPASTIYRSRKPGSSFALPGITASGLLEQADQLQSILMKSGSAILKENPIILKSMEDLAGALYELGEPKESENWWKRIVAIRQRSETRGLRSPAAIFAMCGLLEALYLQAGRLKDAEDLEGKLWSLIRQSLPVDHDLALDFLISKANKLTAAKKWEEAERILRQVLQIRLTSLGPRCTKTIKIMGTLSQSIATRVWKNGMMGKHDQPAHTSSSYLAYTSVQIYSNMGDMLDPEGQQLWYNRIAVLRYLGDYAEAIDLGRMLVQRYEESFGEHHPRTLRYMTMLGVSYVDHKLYPEGVEVLKRVLRLQKLDDTMQDSIFRMQQLAIALRELGRHQEALVYFQKTFENILSLYKTLDEDTKEACRFLGDTYVELRLYEDAVKLYKRYIEEIRVAANDEHPWIVEVQGWIMEVNKHSSTGKDSDDDYSIRDSVNPDST